MGKSIRSKAKRTFRSKKRETGVYAATEAARLQRLNAKLRSVISSGTEGDATIEEGEGEDNDMLAEEKVAEQSPTDPMAVDAETPKRISTHGPRGSRREEWRASKGLAPRPSRNGMNRQGGIAALRKSGRSKRRR